MALCCISKIQKNESNSQPKLKIIHKIYSCVVSQRYRKMKAIHNYIEITKSQLDVVLYLKDTEKWKQFTTWILFKTSTNSLCCISKIQKNESNSQHWERRSWIRLRCVVSQRYRKMKAIHNDSQYQQDPKEVVLYLKDTEKWKQFTTVYVWF